MASELIGEAFLSASLELLFDRMASQQVVDFVRGNKQLDDGLLKLKMMLLLSVNNGVLNDFEKKQISDPSVRKWLDELKQAIYYAEDLVYQIYTEALRCEHEAGQAKSFKLQVLNYFSSRLSVKKVENEIAHGMKEILDSLAYIVKQKGLLVLKGGPVENKPSPRPLLLSSLEGGDQFASIYGRDAGKEAIVKLLLSDNDVGVDKISVIPIVGVGGIGKTTLAQLVFNDDKVNNFDMKVWVTASHELDVFTLAKSIFGQLSARESCNKDPSKLKLKLKRYLEGIKFLCVLDDVWNENCDDWCALKCIFEVAGHDEDCWQLFAENAFNNVEQSGYPDLEVIGKRIVKNCQGLPLAVKLLGGLLRWERNQKEWEKILKDDTWELIDEKECGIPPALWLSYYYLPPHLKRCFAYCSIFPKGYEFQKEDLILLWMAEDLLQPQKNKMVEEVGEEYLNDLTSRSFFHSRCNLFMMHDLVNDLASFVSGEFCLRLDDNDSKVLTSNVRHLSCLRYNHYIKELEASQEKTLLRTLLPEKWPFEKTLVDLEILQTMQCLRVLRISRLSISKLPDSIGNLKLLRYLDLSMNEIEEIPDTIGTLYNLQTLLLGHCMRLLWLPDSIGNLKHLRYLDLSWTSFLWLPDTICNLHNLQTLSLFNCRVLNRLPTNMAKLINLRHLNIEGIRLSEMPPQMSELRYLQTSSDFVVGKNSGSTIKELGKLHDLRGNLWIRGLENVVNVDDVSEANLKDKKRITELSLRWEDHTDDSERELQVLDRLQPHTNLKELFIVNYGGKCFPNWVGHHSFCNMARMELSDCKNCHWLPPLGQLPSLQKLYVGGFDMVEKVGEEFYASGSSSSTKPFNSLEVLTFSNMSKWKEWSLMRIDQQGGAFSQLKKLELRNCPKLTAACMPHHLPSLKTLQLSGCQNLVASLQSDQLPSLGLLDMHFCLEMESFPQGRLPSNIHQIRIMGCEKLVSLLEEGWPSNLKSLDISACGNPFAHRRSMQWNMGMLTSLSCLHISNVFPLPDSFPEEGQLPTTLACLKLSHLTNVNYLNGKALQHLTSIENLTISHCNQLQCLPEEGLPTSLAQLCIMHCPLLQRRCQRRTGEDWPKIAHIPRIRIIGDDV
ncbi:hypothetical protein FNV43_RR20218 [Rhamnella rubrinervis]|uniref:Disease resistance RPP13-like protein 1 n=1 Tax=Rhamnella rubrinervis TaxID=2594499 RepID=A0A8K0DUE9_9ROSA|nr:hypothetical protein FNV43_RR20218 [Rhamnella rubrinervis]